MTSIMDNTCHFLSGTLLKATALSHSPPLISALIRSLGCGSQLSPAFLPFLDQGGITNKPLLHLRQRPSFFVPMEGIFQTFFPPDPPFFRVPFPKRNPPLFRLTCQILFVAVLHQPTFLGNHFCYWLTC